MTNREAFEKVKTHLLTQMERCENDTNCLYRDGTGRKCAIGALIPDAEYSAEFESRALQYVKESCPSLRGLNYQLLRQLQDVHDKTHPTGWAGALARLEWEWQYMPDWEVKQV